MTTPCPPDDVLGAHVQRSLAEPEAAAVAAHLDACAACRQLVVAAVRAGVVAPPETIARGTPSLELTVPALPGRGDGALEPGARIGRYELRALLGAGGMGQVYEAYDAELDRAIALKVMRPGAANGGLLAERLVRESRMMARLAHPAVITVYDVGRAERESVFIAMELIRGETLGRYVRRARPAWRERLALLERAGQGLAAAHDAGIVHRDFKPENVLVELAGDTVKRVLVTDFGVARTAADGDEASGPPVRRSDLELTATGTTVGTPAYMAPEQLEGGDVDARADVFAFAVTAWELVFDERPFEGRTLEELRAAMRGPVRAPRGGSVPARVVRVLERGLARRPEDRFSDMRAFVRALERARRSRTRPVAVATASVAAIAAAVLVVPSALAADEVFDPCERRRGAFEAAYDASRRHAVRAAFADPVAADAAVATLDRAAEEWRATHAGSCTASTEPPQPIGVAACLDARRREVAGVVDDLILDAGTQRYAPMLVDLIGAPSACGNGAPGLATSRLPDDVALRRRVTALRYELFAAEAERDRGAYDLALPHTTALATRAKFWAPLHAEALYLLGTTQSLGGDPQHGLGTLREAAAVAERVHHDYMAVNAWIQLVQASAADNDSERALEYATFAEAALARVGNQADVRVMYLYVKGVALAQADRNAEAEQLLREALALAERVAPRQVALVIQGLGFVLEGHARYGDAVAMYREAIAREPTGGGNPVVEMNYRERLAFSLSMIGQAEEAEVESAKAVALADKHLPEGTLDRAIVHASRAQVLQATGKLDAALAEATATLAQMAKISGERSARYGEMLSVVGTILVDLGRFAEADATLARACEILTFENGEDSGEVAECLVHRVASLQGLGKRREAHAAAERLVARMSAIYGAEHLQVANALVSRGQTHAALGHHAAAVADLERAIAMFEAQPGAIDIGHLGGAEWGLGAEVYKRDPVRGRALVAAAAAKLERAAPSWQQTLADARAWLASHR